MKKKLLTLLCVVTLVIAGFSGCGGDTGSGNNESKSKEGAKAPVVWKLAHCEVADTVVDKYANKFAELVAEKSEGKIKVEVYPVGQLGDSAAELELLQTGGIEIGIFAVAEVGTVFPASQAMALNFLFSEDSKVNQKVLTQGEGTKELANIFSQKNIAVIDWFDLGFMNWTSNKPLHSVKDFKGFKMRIMNTPLISANYSAFGASPTAVPFMETYSSLQLKMVDGTEQPINAIEEMKFYEVQDYITLSNHSILPCFTGINSEFWENLSEEDRGMIEQIIPILQEFAVTTLEEEQNQKRRVILENKPGIRIEELTEQEREAFKAASMSVRKQIEKLAGADGKKVMELIEKDVENFENETN